MNDKSEAFLEMRDGLRKLLKNEDERVALEYFDYITWVEANIQNRPYSELKRMQHMVVA